MKYDPATQAALSDPLGWILLLLLVGALVTVIVVAVVAALELARRRPRLTHADGGPFGVASAER